MEGKQLKRLYLLCIKGKKWIKSAAGVVSIILLIISIILLYAACSDYGNFSERAANNVNNILFGLATNLLGIIVTVSFVQHFVDKQNVKNECKEEVLKIKRYDNFMSVLIERYLMYFRCLITPIEKRDKIGDFTQLPFQFEFQDMCDLYRQSLYLCEGLFESSIELFYKSEETLRNYMIEMIQNIDFKYNKQLQEILIQFVKASIDYDMRGAILGNMTAQSNDEKMTEIVMKSIKDTSYDWVLKEQKGELDSNLMMPYVQLYKLLKDEMKLIQCYKDYIEHDLITKYGERYEFME